MLYEASKVRAHLFSQPEAIDGIEQILNRLMIRIHYGMMTVEVIMKFLDSKDTVIANASLSSCE